MACTKPFRPANARPPFVTTQVPAAKALAAGLVDHVVDANAPDLVQAAASFARRRLPEVAGGLTALRTAGRLLKVGVLRSYVYHLLLRRCSYCGVLFVCPVFLLLFLAVFVVLVDHRRSVGLFCARREDRSRAGDFV